MNQFHFCGGLPRAGSTVLMNILQQNPRIFTGSSSPLPSILSENILVRGRLTENFQAMRVQDADRAMHGLIHGAARGWYEGLTSKPVVISKSRGWSYLFYLFPNSKYIAPIRDLRDIVESFERVNNHTRALHTYNDRGILLPSMTVHEKYDHYFKSSNALSGTLYTETPRLMESFKKKPIFFLRYEDFTKEPITMLRKLYNFLDEPYFEHDLDNIKQSEIYEHDNAYFRERTDHEVKPKFRYYSEPERELPENFHRKIVKEQRWFYEAFYPEVLDEY